MKLKFLQQTHWKRTISHLDLKDKVERWDSAAGWPTGFYRWRRTRPITRRIQGIRSIIVPFFFFFEDPGCSVHHCSNFSTSKLAISFIAGTSLNSTLLLTSSRQVRVTKDRASHALFESFKKRLKLPESTTSSFENVVARDAHIVSDQGFFSDGIRFKEISIWEKHSICQICVHFCDTQPDTTSNPVSYR